MTSTIRWGLLAAGSIAKAFAKGVQDSESGRLQAVASRDAGKAAAFAEAYNIPNAHSSYEALLADPEVDAVYISTPHPFHTEWAIKAAEAGKHILCEKPLAMNAYECMAIVDAAATHQVFLMEAYMYRCHPQTHKLIELLRSGVIGELRNIKATFSFGKAFHSEGRLWEQELAGGAILDVGGYTSSYACMVAGVAQGSSFAVPREIKALGVLSPESGVDGLASALLRFDHGVIAECSTGIAASQENCVQIFGSEGWMKLPDPYAASRVQAKAGCIQLFTQASGCVEDIQIDSPRTSYAYEADVCGRAILSGKSEAEYPAMSWQDSIHNAQLQDAWRKEIGLIYDREKPENMLSHNFAGRPLTRQRPLMKPGRVEFQDKELSRLIMGVDNQVSSPHCQAVFDQYFELGGNAFDTAYGYGEVKSRLLGRWLRSRALREDIVLIAKGAHTPNCNPESVVSQLEEQLEWLGTDYADIYMLHRDNPEIPVSEFMDVLNEQVQAGRIQSFGGSNWSLERIAEANAYAEKQGLQRMSIASNNLSLAVMQEPVWAGCIHVHDDASLKWLEEQQITLLPWSSQARGFFLPERAHPEKREDASLVRSWYSAENFERQKRAIELAATHGVDPINISLAWVLGQHFPVYALIGPRTLAETRSSLRSLEVELSEAEMAYLDLKIPSLRESAALV